ncbi:MAG: undecaprenyl/decaprenyl-phosphate alpha-N-acetylglucosaminyl 1-phosphate transferase [Chloroflexota bacterium]|nr:undecaprenyl/decaprenyl-phosphate alpha-N-acetylglucosaminyl 1-phosphate transferase [Chloroflexota bacterium]
MLSSIAALTVASVAAWVLTPVIRVAARRRGLLDEPTERKVHGVAIPRLGGVAIAVAFYLGIAAGLVVETLAGGQRSPTDQIVVVLLGAALVACIGLLDDLVGMRARVKLAAQIGVALVVVLLGLSIDHLDGPWGSFPLGPWALPLTVAWFVVVMNAMNLIDGLDGLASGVALIAMAVFYLVATSGGLATPIALVLAAAAGGVIGFLPYNLYPATIIMGDTGAILLGFLLAAAGVAVTQSGSPGAAVWVPVAALGLALADTGWAVVRRIASGAPILAPDKRHVHHRLLAAGLSQRTTMVVLWLVSAALGLIAVFTAR